MISPSLFRNTGVVFLLLMLTACASLTSSPISEDAARQAAARPYHQAIDLGGRISVRYQGRYKEELLHGGFSWQQRPAHTTISLLSPLGQTMAVIKASQDGASLLQNGRTTHAPDVDVLTSNQLGWTLPVAGMREWLQGFGLDAQGKPFVATPRNDTVTTVDGWQIHYVAWQNNEVQAGPLYPRRVDLLRNTAQAGEISIRIVIDSWQAP